MYEYYYISYMMHACMHSWPLLALVSAHTKHSLPVAIVILMCVELLPFIYDTQLNWMLR